MWQKRERESLSRMSLKNESSLSRLFQSVCLESSFASVARFSDEMRALKSGRGLVSYPVSSSYLMYVLLYEFVIPRHQQCTPNAHTHRVLHHSEFYCEVIHSFMVWARGWRVARWAVIPQSASIARSQGLLESICASSSCNFLLAWLHSSCSMAHRPGELPQKLSSKPCDWAIDALCTVFMTYHRWYMYLN